MQRHRVSRTRRRRACAALPVLAALTVLALPAPAKSAAAPEPDAGGRDALAERAPAADRTPPRADPADPIELLGERIEPGTLRRLTLASSQSFAGISVITPVVVLHGARRGPRVCLIAGVHGDEINGVEIVRRVLSALDPVGLSGTVIGVPIANPHGFRRSSRYLPDRRDLNRYFPGRPGGSSASRIAWALFEGVIRHCGVIVDYHTGSFHRTNLPHLRADLRNPQVRLVASKFGTPIVVHNAGRPGTLRRAATDIGIPALTYEAGEPMRLNEAEIVAGERGTHVLLTNLGLTGRGELPVEQTHYLETHWIRADRGGLLLGTVSLGERVEPGSLLGIVMDPISSDRSEIRSPYRGRVIGRALDQVVIPGFASFHIAVENGTLQPFDGDDGYTGDEPEPDTLTIEPEERPE